MIKSATFPEKNFPDESQSSKKQDEKCKMDLPKFVFPLATLLF